jgi:tetratricopeptide (TPR) repeat protein
MMYNRILVITSRSGGPTAVLFGLCVLMVCALTLGCQSQTNESSAVGRGEDGTAASGTQPTEVASTELDRKPAVGTLGISSDSTKAARTDLQETSTAGEQPEIAVDQLRESALQALGDGQDDVAFQLVRKAMRLDPENPQVVFLFAMVLGDRHRYAEAIQILQKLADRDPATRLPALGQTTEWMVEAGRYGEAEQQYRSILKEVPDALMVHHRLGQLLLQSGRRTEAAKHFEYLSQFGELDQEELRSLLIRSQAFPGDDQFTRFTPLTNLAVCRQELASGKIDQVLDRLSEGGNENSNAELALLARLRAVRSDMDGVQGWVQQERMSDVSADAWYAKGWIAMEQQDYPQAVGCFCRVLLIDQTDADAYRMLSQALKKNGDPSRAQVAAARAELVEQTRVIGADLVGEENRDRELISKLIALLNKLNRPLEAFGWQSVDLVYAVEAAAISETQAQSTFEMIGRQRAQLVNSGQHTLDPAFVLCGLASDALDPTRVLSQ